MRSKLIGAAAAGFGLLLACFPAMAHHSFAAEFDTKKPVELHGTVVTVEWVNPHAWIHMEVKDENGKAVPWACELGSPNLLMRNGWRPNTLKPGDAIVVNGSAAKDGTNLANARTVKLANGDRVFNAGSSGDPGTPGASVGNGAPAK